MSDTKYVTVHPGIGGAWRVLYLGVGDNRQRLPGTLDGDNLPTAEAYAAHMAEQGYVPQRALPGPDTPKDTQGYVLGFARHEPTQADAIMNLAKPRQSADKPDDKANQQAKAALAANLRNVF